LFSMSSLLVGVSPYESDRFYWDLITVALTPSIADPLNTCVPHFQ
jgi:hypothetical protein